MKRTDPLPKIPKGAKLTGLARREMGEALAARYDADPGLSVRALAEETGRSYGSIHRLLAQYTQLRGRGGARRSRGGTRPQVSRAGVPGA